jgi:hypothetical protein
MDIDEQVEILRKVESSVVQSGINKEKSGGKTKEEKFLRTKYNRIAKALIGTTSDIGWMQLNADEAEGQRGEVMATTASIVKKAASQPTAPVSYIGVFYNNHFGGVWCFDVIV